MLLQLGNIPSLEWFQAIPNGESRFRDISHRSAELALPTNSGEEQKGWRNLLLLLLLLRPVTMGRIDMYPRHICQVAKLAAVRSAVFALVPLQG